MNRTVAFLGICLLTAIGGECWADASRSTSVEDSVRYAKLVARIGTSKNPSLEELESAVKIYAADGDVWRALAVAQFRAKEYPQSVESNHRAIELGGFDNMFRAAAEYDIACSYALMNKIEEGYHWLDISMEHGFRDLDHLRKDTDLNNLHSDKRWQKVAATEDVSKMSRNEGWRYDIWLLDRELRRIHFNPYRVTTKQDMDSFVSSLKRDVPKLNDNEITARCMMFVRMFGDGHTRLRPSHGQSEPTLPLQLFWFDEGVFVTLAKPELKDLVGAQVIAINGRPFEDLVPELSKIIFRDNPQGVRSFAPILATYPRALNGLGLGPDTDQIRLTVRDSTGETREATVKAESGVAASSSWATPRDTKAEVQPLYLKNRQKPYWYEYLPEKKLVYFQYNSVRNDNDIAADLFAELMFKFIDEHEVDSLVVDARWNGGGNSFLNRPFVNGIISNKKVNRPGHLFVVIGRQTFSAAQNFVTDLGRACEPIFVGEPSGSSPNFVGESVRGNLPYSKLEFTVSDLYWQRSWPMDCRTWIAPQLPAPPSFQAYRENRDPALEAVFAYLSSTAAPNP